MKMFWNCLIIISFLFLSTCVSMNGGKDAPMVAPEEKQRGVSWVAGPREITEDQVAYLHNYHVNWIVQTPFGWQTGHNTPDLKLHTTKVFWGETDEGLTVSTRLAKGQGIKTLLKPHIWLKRPEEGKWRTHIAMNSEQDWQTWFAQYKEFILHYAKLAESLSIEALCVGTELHAAALAREADWREVIREVRAVYNGQLTYAANWYEEYEQIAFWDALDWIGIQAYFPLSKDEAPTTEALIQGWQSHLIQIESVQKRFDKPVIFTEVGYRANVNAAIEPWLWPKHRDKADEQDLQTQVRLYEAFFHTFWDQPWFAGAYIWKWFPLAGELKPPHNRNFTPQGKPANEVLRTWYGKTAKAVAGDP